MSSGNSKSKLSNWCDTKPSHNLNEADRAPIPQKDTTYTMPMQFPIGKKFYPCQTQDGIQPTFGQPPHNNSDLGGGSGIVVGIKDIIPRWAASLADPTKLLYFAIREGFPSDDDFQHTTTSFQQAADEWNALEFGVHISRTLDRALANFVIKYKMNPPDKPTVIASAFFPNDVDDVIVYHFTLVDPEMRPVLKNSFLHEIGHIIGLRHEFAIEADTHGNGPEGDGATQFGSKNPISVMSYETVNYIQPTDKEDVKKFYKLENCSEIAGVRIYDYVPKPLKQ